VEVFLARQVSPDTWEALVRPGRKLPIGERVIFGDGELQLPRMVFARVLGRMGHGDVTPHGFRSSFRDWGGDKTNYPRDLLEFALGHKVGDETEIAYRRSDGLEK